MTSLVEQFAALPRQGNFDDKRELILREAARLFVEQGVHETALSELAERFSISKPALYHYARSKDDIIAQILQAAQIEQRRILDGIDQPPGSGKQRLRLLLQRYGATLSTEFGRCLATVQSGSFSAQTQALHVSTLRIILEGAADIVEQGMVDGSIRACRPKLVVLSIFNALNAMVRWHRPQGVLSHAQAVDEIIDCFMHGIATDVRNNAARDQA